jgi:class 3 adenylate cyclase
MPPSRAVVASALVAAAFVALAEWVFPLLPKAEAGLPSMRAEDAEVDELLRMIANAEEALEDRHSMDAAVLITDMKSFSRLTQEQGTVATAKMIQRHRDLLLPIASSCGGHGKSTGGDGLVAAFHSTEDALTAAVKMQQALRDYNARKAEDKQIHVRIGVAAGDVIVDRAGCPFIGDALNLAARVMGLADGGQVFAAADVVDAATDLPSPVVPHGEFTLKNITRPVGIFEVLWDEGQEPRRPEAEPTAAA